MRVVFRTRALVTERHREMEAPTHVSPVLLHHLLTSAPTPTTSMCRAYLTPFSRCLVSGTIFDNGLFARRLERAFLMALDWRIDAGSVGGAGGKTSHVLVTRS